MHHTGRGVPVSQLAVRQVHRLAHAQLQAQAADLLLQSGFVSCQHSLLCVGLLQGCCQHLHLVLPHEGLRLQGVSSSFRINFDVQIFEVIGRESPNTDVIIGLLNSHYVYTAIIGFEPQASTRPALTHLDGLSEEKIGAVRHEATQFEKSPRSLVKK